ncbi:MAG: prepilin-type N-terminal cleavage/methylation domain-containing protein [Gammaproteobacteria bacterium]|nr:prepilin-type N-terminal cleavage/methylation domain-containing protein [Gammaproteobacteria bacterium]
MTTFSRHQINMQGFTLIELVMVIVLIGALSSVASIFIAGPVQGFMDSNRRAELVDITETALQRMTREIHDALPNSIRISNNGTQFAIEYLSTLTGGRYRNLQATAGPGNKLNFNSSSDSFDILGGLPDFGDVDAAGGSGQANCLNNTVDCLVIYNTGTSAADFNAYNGDNIAAITAVSNNSMTFNNSDIPGWSFPAKSPNNRFFVVDSPVSFVCDSGSGELLMYQGYNVMAGQPLTPASFGVAGAVLADKVSNCGASTFLYNAGAGVRYGLVVIRLTISDAGESVSLLQQAHVLNTP